MRLLVSDQPLAWTSGWVRPWLLLSNWMEEHLDRRELEAVIMHELAHVARRDTLVLWMGRVLRDAFWYLPTSRAAYRQLEQDKEFACDDLVVGVTHRPLALASALTKVWLQAVDGTATSTFELAHYLEGTRPQMVERIERLMAKHVSSTAMASAPSGISVLSALGVVETLILLLLFAVMACGPVLLLARWV
jgi:beta-lactamase regulating signal transducer with metallopeptidase domain